MFGKIFLIRKVREGEGSEGERRGGENSVSSLQIFLMLEEFVLFKM